MDEKLLILLGLGTIGYLAATNFNCDDDNSEDEDSNYEEETNSYSNSCNSPYIMQNQVPYYENYTDNQMHMQQQESPKKEEFTEQPIATVSYQNAPVNPFDTKKSASPLEFGSMIQEDFVPSDYLMLSEYGKQDPSLPIPVYNEKDGTTSLPVSDMTDMSAGEENKYIYDRTIGTIGFTSTKIGGRRRGQADYIRGDLPIFPDQSPWFQVSSDPLNTLVEGALGNNNALGSESTTTSTSTAAPTSTSGGQRAMRRVIKETDQGDVDVGQCDDDDPNYIQCVKDLIRKSGREATMSEIKRAYAVANSNVTRNYAGFSP